MRCSRSRQARKYQVAPSNSGKWISEYSDKIYRCHCRHSRPFRLCHRLHRSLDSYIAVLCIRAMSRVLSFSQIITIRCTNNCWLIQIYRFSFFFVQGFSSSVLSLCNFPPASISLAKLKYSVYLCRIKSNVMLIELYFWGGGMSGERQANLILHDFFACFFLGLDYAELDEWTFHSSNDKISLRFVFPSMDVDVNDFDKSWSNHRYHFLFSLSSNAS